MRRTLRIGAQGIDVFTADESDPSDSLREFRDTDTALSFLRKYAHDCFRMSILRQVLAAVDTSVFLSRLADREVLRQLARHIVRGKVRLAVEVKQVDKAKLPDEWRRFGGATQATEKEVAEPRAPRRRSVISSAPPARVQRKTAAKWIEFRVVDDETDEPIAGIDLEVKLPTGELEQCTTDASGIVRIEDLASGACDIDRIRDSEAFEVIRIE